MLEIEMKKVGDRVFLAKTSDGFRIKADAAGKHGPAPMELLLVALGSCSGTVALQLLAILKQDVDGMTVKLLGEKENDRSSLLKALQIEYRISGRLLQEKKVERAIRLAEKKFCPISLLLRRAGVKVESSCTLNPSRSESS